MAGCIPSYHWQEILEASPEIDVIVRGEGEATVVSLVSALEAGRALSDVPGLAFHDGGLPAGHPPCADDPRS